MMAVNVLEWQRTAVAHAAMHLHGSVRRLAAEAVSAEVADRHHVADLRWILTIHLPSGSEDEISHQLVFGPQFHQRKLNGLFLGERLAEDDA
jgi:hypothetical protein